MLTAPLVYSLNDAADVLEEDRNLITYLIQDREIPHKKVGRNKVIDDKGLDMLRQELIAYRAKGDKSASA